MQEKSDITVERVVALAREYLRYGLLATRREFHDAAWKVLISLDPSLDQPTGNLLRTDPYGEDGFAALREALAQYDAHERDRAAFKAKAEKTPEVKAKADDSWTSAVEKIARLARDYLTHQKPPLVVSDVLRAEAVRTSSLIAAMNCNAAIAGLLTAAACLAGRPSGFGGDENLRAALEKYDSHVVAETASWATAIRDALCATRYLPVPWGLLGDLAAASDLKATKRATWRIAQYLSDVDYVVVASLTAESQALVDAWDRWVARGAHADRVDVVRIGFGSLPAKEPLYIEVMRNYLDCRYRDCTDAAMADAVKRLRVHAAYGKGDHIANFVRAISLPPDDKSRQSNVDHAIDCMQGEVARHDLARDVHALPFLRHVRAAIGATTLTGTDPKSVLDAITAAKACPVPAPPWLARLWTAVHRSEAHLRAEFAGGRPPKAP